MIKYAKIIDPITGLCEVAQGTNIEFYKSIGMKELNVVQSDIDSMWYLEDKCPTKTKEELEQEEKERINKLSLTKREVFLALYKDKSITPEDLRAKINDPAALIEFDYANEYYRGNPLIDQIGSLLGYTSDDLDYLFLNKELPQELDKE